MLEDVNEPLYRIDRMLRQLILSGALARLAGLCFGAFTERGDESRRRAPLTRCTFRRGRSARARARRDRRTNRACPRPVDVPARRTRRAGVRSVDSCSRFAEPRPSHMHPTTMSDAHPARSLRAHLRARHERGERSVLLDVREQNEWNLFRIPNAIHIPLAHVSDSGGGGARAISRRRCRGLLRSRRALGAGRRDAARAGNQRLVARGRDRRVGRCGRRGRGVAARAPVLALDTLARLERALTPVGSVAPAPNAHGARCRGRRDLPRRADNDALELLMIERASYAGDPWSGHVAFPGGRREPRRRTLLDTALRETREEIGIDLATHGRVLGALERVNPMSPALPPLSIAPFVALLTRDVAARAERRGGRGVLDAAGGAAASGGIDATWRSRCASGRRTVRAFVHGRYTIWGLTERILRDLLSRLS